MPQKDFARSKDSVIAQDVSTIVTGDRLSVPSRSENHPAPKCGAEGLLLRRVADKDQVALSELYQLTSGKLFNIALLLLRRSDLAEEVLKTSYARIWQDAASFDGALQMPIDWMTTIVRKHAIELLHKDELQPCATGTILPGTTNLSSQAEDASANATASHKVPLPSSLDVDRSLLLATAYLHGQSREQLSERFGLSVDAIKTSLRTALLEIHRSTL